MCKMCKLNVLLTLTQAPLCKTPSSKGTLSARTLFKAPLHKRRLIFGRRTLSGPCAAGGSLQSIQQNVNDKADENRLKFLQAPQPTPF